MRKRIQGFNRRQLRVEVYADPSDTNRNFRARRYEALRRGSN